VAKIFAAKGRPATNPLIVHVPDVEVAKRYTTRWTEHAQLLAERFWPGPLTLVLPKAETIAANVTAGGPTVGLRAPDHPVALAMLRGFDGPVAAPSANRSNAVSPTTAKHVRDELGATVNVMLDGGPCAVGIESTVLDLSREGSPAILRPGGVSREQIEAVIGPVKMGSATVGQEVVAASPGQQAVHYAPRVPAYRVPYRQVPQALSLLSRQSVLGQILVGDWQRTGRTSLERCLPGEPIGYAREIYAAIREIDAALAAVSAETRDKAILIELPPDQPEWDAVRDRLVRATRPIEESKGTE
jgi:L-threonylcarbamoyladenylate synthase